MKISIFVSGDDNPNAVLVEINSLDQLVEFVTNNSWSPIVFRENYRQNKNFLSEELIALDIDGKVNLATALTIFSPYKHVICTTRNHQKSKDGVIADRFRVILFLSKPITDTATHSATYSALLKKFSFADEKCRNSGRHFYPSREVISVNHHGIEVDPVVPTSTEVVSFKSTPTDIVLPSVSQRIQDFKKFLSNKTMDDNGGRNNQMFSLSSMGNKDFALEGDADKELEQILLDFNDKSINPLSKSEVLSAIRHGKKYGQNVRGFYYELTKPISITLLDDDEPKKLPELKDQVKKKIALKQEKEPEKKASESGHSRAAIIAKVIDEAEGLGINDKYKVVTDGLMVRYVRVQNGILYPCMHRQVANWFGLFYESRFTPQEGAILTDSWTRRIENNNQVINIQDIKPFFFLNERPPGVYAWYRMPFDPSDDVFLDDIPEFYDILSRTSNEEAKALVLWIGSLLDYTSDRSQYIHISGEGNDGKGSLISMLEVIFAGSFCKMSSSDFKDTHAFQKLEGKRLAVFSDEANTHFISSGKFKELTGDNELTINPKKEPQRNITANFKILIASNNRPSPEDTRADLRRILPIFLSDIKGQVDTSYKTRLKQSAPKVMQYCYSQYQKWVTASPNQPIPTPLARVKEVIEIAQQSYTDFIDQYFVLEDDAELPRAYAYTFLKQHRFNDHEINKIYAFLKTRGCQIIRKNEAGKRANIIKGLRLREITFQ